MKLHLQIPFSAALAWCSAATFATAADPVTVVFQNGLNEYTGTFDRRIGPGSTEIDGSTVGGQTSFYIDGGSSTLNDSGYSQLLIRFSDVESALPAGAKILQAKITVVTKTHGNAQSGNSFNVYRLTRPFDSLSSVTSDFGSDGLAGDVDWILGSFEGMTAASTATVVSADVTRAVQSWLDGSPNLGLGIRSDRGTDGWSFHSTGATQELRPKLEVTYILTEGARVDEFQQGFGDYSGSSQIFLNGTGASSELPGQTIVGWTVAESWLDGLNPPTTEPDISSMIRFDTVETALAGRKIERAILRLVTGFSSSAADSPGPFTVHRLLVPFTESSQYADFAGDAGAMLAAGQITPAITTLAGVLQDTEVVDADVTEAVRAWAAGAPNHGLYIGSGTPNGWQIFTTGASDVGFRPLLHVVSTPALPVQVLSPADGARVVQGSQVSLQAEATSTPPATVTQVRFLINGQPVATVTGPPYSLDYTPQTLGTFSLTAEKTDSEGVIVTSQPVAFTVVPPAGLGALYFDGLADHVTFGNPTELGLTTMTLETWFRRETEGASTTTGNGGVVAIPLVAKGRNQGENSTLDLNWFLGIRASDGVLCADFEGAAGANVPVVGTTPVPYGVWQHAAATFDGSEWRLYLNGSLEAVRSANGLTPRFDSIQHASLATAMNSNGLGEGAFGGFLDEVRIWNIARTHSEIRSAIHTEIPTANGLVARWGMEEAGGNTITSTATNATPGSLAGSPVRSAGQSFSGNILPQISFLGPQDGRNFTRADVIELRVDASDPDGSVARVEYYDHGSLVATSTTPPYSFDYSQPPAGTRRIRAAVIDNQGDASWTDNILTFQVTFPAPTVPGYSAALIDGGDAELATGTPAAAPANWSVLAGSPPPRSFGSLGTLPGDLGLSLDGLPLPDTAGILLTGNFVPNPANLAAIDNIVTPYLDNGNYRVSSSDNNGPGEIDPLVAPESSSFALGWFPYADGWIGGRVLADGSLPAGGLPATVSVQKTATGTYVISGLPSSGNLIANAMGSLSENQAAVGRSGEDWVVTVRDNSQNLADGDFALLYVPVTARRVLSGAIGNLAETTSLNEELDRVGMSCELTAQGYQLTFGDGSLHHPGNTALFVVPDSDAGNGPDNLYSVLANGPSFVVFSHDLPGLNGVLQNGGFRFLALPLDPTPPIAGEITVRSVRARTREDESDARLVFTIQSSTPAGADLEIAYSLSGSATAGSDYIAPAGTILLPAGTSSVDLTLPVLADSLAEPVETVSLQLAPGSGYTLGSQASASGTIEDGSPVVPGAVTVSFQQGTDGYTGQFQRRIGLTLPATYTAEDGDTVTSYAVDGGNPDINDMIRFADILGTAPGQIPAGATILRAELILTTSVSSDAQSSGPFIVDRLTSAFDRSTTYDAISQGPGFEGVRGISTGLPVAGFPAAAQGQAVAADVTAIVRDWTAGEPNHGFAITSGGTSDGWNYQTVGSGNVAGRPKLVVTYVTSPTRTRTYFADRSARITSAPNEAGLDGATLDTATLARATNNTQEALLRFPVGFGDGAEDIPADEEIIKAELLVTTPGSFFGTGTHTTAPLSLHPLLVDWTPAASFGLFGPQVGSHIGPAHTSLTGLGQGSTTWVDVTALVRRWRAGEPNHGFNLKPGGGDDWAMFWPGSPFAEFAGPRLRITTATSGGTPADPFETWATSFGLTGLAESADPDGDGLSALLEYALGGSPLAQDSLPAPQRQGNRLVLTYPKGALAAADPTLQYRWFTSIDLVDWTPQSATSETSESTTFEIEIEAGAPKRFMRMQGVRIPQVP